MPFEKINYQQNEGFHQKLISKQYQQQNQQDVHQQFAEEEDVEYLQLGLEEAFFLMFALNVLNIRNEEGSEMR